MTLAIKNLDESKGWRLHLALSQVLVKIAEDSGDPTLMGEALKEVNSALRLQSRRERNVVTGQPTQSHGLLPELAHHFTRAADASFCGLRFAGAIKRREFVLR